jgi:hypothetical protein
MVARQPLSTQKGRNVKFAKFMTILLSVVVIIVLGGIVMLRLEPIQRLIQDKLYDNVPSFTPCDQLPSAAVAQDA